jgi:hypothetical protein
VRRLLPLLILLAPATVDAAGWRPVRVNLQCQGWGRTKSCPAFLRGFIDAAPVLVHAPLADAEVVLYYNVTTRARFDLVHLRLTSRLAGAPRAIEVLQEVDSRASDDDQRAALEPAFLRGIAPFVAAAVPEAVKVELVAPTSEVAAAPATTPWGFSLWSNGWGNWSESYRSANLGAGGGVSRVTADSTFSQSVGGSYTLSRQPALEVDGERISLDTDAHAIEARTSGARSLDRHFAVGGLIRAGREDPVGRYRSTVRAHAGASFDLFAADDPRGNALSIAYLAGVQADRYNALNLLGERRAWFPSHALLAGGSVRRDTITYSVHAAVLAQLLRPGRRHVVEIQPSISLQLGAHVDVSVSGGVTRQAIPGPAAIDAGDFEQVTRAGYAEPIQINGNFHLNLHWDRSNAGRNNRWQVTGVLGELDSL